MGVHLFLGSLHLGFHTLEKTKPSHSVPALVSYDSIQTFSGLFVVLFIRLCSQIPITIPPHLPQSLSSVSVRHVLKSISFLNLTSKSLHVLFVLLDSYCLCIFLLFTSLIDREMLFYVTESFFICLMVALAIGVLMFILCCIPILMHGVLCLLFLENTGGFWNVFFDFIDRAFSAGYSHACFVLLISPIITLIALWAEHFSEHKTRSGMLLALEISLFFASADKYFFPVIVLFISHLISVCWALFSRFTDHPRLNIASANVVNIAIRFVGLKMKEILWKMKEKKTRKFIEFAVGTLGAIIFQNFFTVTSFNEVVAYVCFAMMWLSNMVLSGFRCDFGVFKFLLSNAVVGSAVGRFGLHRVTWLAFGAVLLLFGLQLMLNSVTVAYEEGQRIRFPFFGDGLLHCITPIWMVCFVIFICCLLSALLVYAMLTYGEYLLIHQ